MRILYILTQDLESPSGLGRYFPIAKELVKLGHEVSIVALHSNYGSLKIRRFIKDDVNISYIGQMHVRKIGNEKVYFNTPKLLLISLLGTIKLTLETLFTPIDIIHICKPHPMNGLAGIIGKSFKNCLLFLDCDDIEISSNKFNSEWQCNIVSFFEKWLPKRVDYITTNTYFSKARLMKMGIEEKKIMIIPNGVDKDRFYQPKRSEIRRKNYEYDLKNYWVIAYIGSLSLNSHPIDILFYAFKEIMNSKPSARLLIVGGGEDFCKLKKLAKELDLEKHIVFSGKIKPNDIPIYYSLADVVVDPTHDNLVARGRSPLKLFESWICSVPLITSNVGDRQLILGDPPAGILSNPGDPHSLSNCILELMNDKSKAKKIVELGKERVKSYYWDFLVQKLDEFYKNVN